MHPHQDIDRAQQQALRSYPNLLQIRAAERRAEHARLVEATRHAVPLWRQQLNEQGRTGT